MGVDPHRHFRGPSLSSLSIGTSDNSALLAAAAAGVRDLTTGLALLRLKLANELMVMRLEPGMLLQSRPPPLPSP